MNSKLTLVSEKSAQQRLLTLLAVKAAMAQENNSEEEQECLMILARAMQFFSFTTKDLDPYVQACCGLLFDNELCYEERREMLEHNCGLNKFEELFAQFEYLYMQKTVPKEHLQFLLQSYRNLKKESSQNGKRINCENWKLLSTCPLDGFMVSYSQTIMTIKTMNDKITIIIIIHCIK